MKVAGFGGIEVLEISTICTELARSAKQLHQPVIGGGALEFFQVRRHLRRGDTLGKAKKRYTADIDWLQSKREGQFAFYFSCSIGDDNRVNPMHRRKVFELLRLVRNRN